MRPPEPSMPPSQPVTHLLGTGSGATSSRAFRPALVLVVVVVAALVAIPLYWWRRPEPVEIEQPRELAETTAAAEVFRPSPDPSQALVAAALDGGVQTDHVQLGAVWIDGCQQGKQRLTPARCDRLVYFEQALIRAILDGADCAPRNRSGATISYALTVDFQRKRVQLFAGKSGTVRKNEAQATVSCVAKKLALPSWQTVPHLYSRYTIAVLAKYP